MGVRRWLNSSSGVWAVAGGFLLTAVAACLLFPFPPIPSDIPRANGKALGLAVALHSSQVIFAGSERYLTAVDYHTISQQLGVPVAKFTARQAGPAWMYLFLKNLAPEGAVVVIPYSGVQLTFAELYADSGRAELAYLMQGREPEVERLTYLGRQPAQEYWLRRLLPFYAWREETGKTTGRLLERMDDTVFTSAAADPAQRLQHEAAREQASRAYDARVWDFPQQYRSGYLPLLLQIAQAKRLRLVWLELPGLRADDPVRDTTYRTALHHALEREYSTWIEQPSADVLPEVLLKKLKLYLQR